VTGVFEAAGKSAGFAEATETYIVLSIYSYINM